MSTLYEIVELANGDIALQKESGSKKVNNGAPLVTMRFSTDLLRFLRGAKMDIAKVMIEAGLERVANLAESATREELEAKIDSEHNQSIPESFVKNAKLRRPTEKLMRRRGDIGEKEEKHPVVSHLVH